METTKPTSCTASILPKALFSRDRFKSSSLRFVACGLILLGASNQTFAGLISPSEAGYTQVYGLHIANSDNLHSNVPYYLNSASSIVDGSFSRIAYHMELQRSGGPLEFVWVSMDAFTNNASLTGVPSIAGSNTVFQQSLTNMNVFSNQTGIVTGLGLATGNIEFWRDNYVTSNIAGVPNANGAVYDTGDQRQFLGTYGSMQIHNNDITANQTLFALNRFNGAHDIGIGNQGSSHTDWTFAANAGQYTIKTLDVWVGNAVAVPEPASLALLGLGLAGLGFSRRKKA